MKKKLFVVGLLGVISLLIGAIGVEVITLSNNTASTWNDCLNAYLELRTSTPPLPLPSSAEELLERAENGDFSFITEDEHWYITQSKILYTESNSELVQALGALPCKLIAMEDIRLGSIILYSVDEKGVWNPEAMFDAPAIVDETDSEYMALSAEDKSRVLYSELSFRRVVGEITLQPASVLTALVSVSQTSLSAQSVQAVVPQMMTMSVPVEHTNDLWLAQETQNNGTVQLQVFAPDALTNIEVFAATDLRGVWSRIATNVNPSSATNPEYIA